jgi:hypothetical protein
MLNSADACTGHRGLASTPAVNNASLLAALLTLRRWPDAAQAARVYDRAAILLYGHATSTNNGVAAALADVDCPIRQQALREVLQAAAMVPRKRRWESCMNTCDTTDSAPGVQSSHTPSR